MKRKTSSLDIKKFNAFVKESAKEGLEEIGKRPDTGEIVIRIDPRYYRPTEVEELLGDASKAKKQLNWEPKISLEDLVSEMVQNDLKISNQNN